MKYNGSTHYVINSFPKGPVLSISLVYMEHLMGIFIMLNENNIISFSRFCNGRHKGTIPTPER